MERAKAFPPFAIPVAFLLKLGVANAFLLKPLSYSNLASPRLECLSAVAPQGRRWNGQRRFSLCNPSIAPIPVANIRVVDVDVPRKTHNVPRLRLAVPDIPLTELVIGFRSSHLTIPHSSKEPKV